VFSSRRGLGLHSAQTGRHGAFVFWLRGGIGSVAGTNDRRELGLYARSYGSRHQPPQEERHMKARIITVFLLVTVAAAVFVQVAAAGWYKP
jgi:hypothetical protein